MHKILLVEDEEDMIEIITYVLKENAFEVKPVETLSKMWEILEKDAFDLILLDIGLPDGSGMEALKNIKSRKIETPVIMVTARRSDMDKVLGLELGADDYVTKPFNTYELLARIKAVLRRTRRSTPMGGGKLKIGKKVLDLDSYTAVDENGKKIEFANKELELFKLLLSHPTKVFTREEILDKIWGEDFFGEFRTVDVHVSKIRSKLGDNVIKTVRGVGYKLGEGIGE